MLIWWSGIGVTSAVEVLAIVNGHFLMLTLKGELQGNRKRGQYSPLGVNLRQIVDNAAGLVKGHVHYQRILQLSCCLFWDSSQVLVL